MIDGDGTGVRLKALSMDIGAKVVDEDGRLSLLLQGHSPMAR